MIQRLILMMALVLSALPSAEIVLEGACLPIQRSAAGGVALLSTVTPAAGVQVSGGVRLQAYAPPAPRSVDTDPPRLTLVLSATRLQVGESLTVTVSSSEVLADWDSSWLASALPADAFEPEASTSGTSQPGVVLTASYKALRTGTFPVAIPAGAGVDAGANPSPAVASVTVTVIPSSQPEPMTLVAPASAVVGQPLVVLAIDGYGTTTLTADGRAIAAVRMTPADRDLDGDGDYDPSTAFLVTPSSAGTLTLAAVSGISGATRTLTVTAPVAAPVDLAVGNAAAVPVSRGRETRFFSVCMGSREAVARLLGRLAAVDDDRRLRIFAWDAVAQAMRDLPDGAPVSPGDGLFIATRDDLDLNFDGGALPEAEATMTLLPGWNFVGLPAMTDATGTVIGSIDLEDLSLQDAFGHAVAGDARRAVIGDVVYLWNGAAYERVTTLTLGRGYWIANRDADGGSYALRRTPGSAGRQRHIVARNLPPLPVPASSSGTDSVSSGSGCGAGLGLAALFGLLVLARRRRR